MSAGIGYNVVKYCCSVCKTAKVELCHNDSEHHDCCGGLAHKGNHHHSDNHQCALVYLKADFPIIEKSENINIEPKELDLPIILAHDFSTKTTIQTQNNLCPYKHFIRGRDMLSKISILTI